MDCSFTPDGKFFVFSTATGKTLRAGFPNKAAALAWMAIAAKKDSGVVRAPTGG